MKVFLIDDNDIDLLISRKLLHKYDENIIVEQFKEPRQALKEIVRAPYDLPNVIFLDLNMPIMSGWDFLDSLPKMVQAPPIIYLLTSSLDDRDREKAKDYPIVQGYLTKPLSLPVIDTLLH